VSSGICASALAIGKCDDFSSLCAALQRLLGHAPRPALASFSGWVWLSTLVSDSARLARRAPGCRTTSPEGPLSAKSDNKIKGDAL
jgi:hypothetical protein